MTDYENSLAHKTDSLELDCKGASGDMIYITDTKLDEVDGVTVGHGFAEVKVLKAGR